MPKQTKKRDKRQRQMGPVSHWPIHKRLEYHLAECAMHLQMIEQILGDEREFDGQLPSHREQIGIRLKLIYRECRKKFPKMLKQPWD